MNGGIHLTAADFTDLDPEELIRLSDDAKRNVKKVDLKFFGLSLDDWGTMSGIGNYCTADHYDGGHVTPFNCELFVNNQRMTTARYPNHGYLYTEESIFEGEGKEHTTLDYDRTYKLTEEEWMYQRNPRGDISRIDAQTNARIKNWKHPETAWIFGYPRYDWADASSPVILNTNECTMENTYVSIYGTKDCAPYYFYNVFEELDAPQEWFFDRENGILYLYPPTDLSDCEIYFSVSTSDLLSIQGASYLTFSG